MYTEKGFLVLWRKVNHVALFMEEDSFKTAHLSYETSEVIKTPGRSIQHSWMVPAIRDGGRHSTFQNVLAAALDR